MTPPDPHLFARDDRLVFEVRDEFGPIVFATIADALDHVRRYGASSVIARFSVLGERVHGALYQVEAST